MASPRKTSGLFGLVALLCLSGCVDTLAQSKQFALQAASVQISKLTTAAANLAGESSSAQDLLSRVQTGDLGIVFPDPLPPETVLPGPTFTVIYGGKVSGDAVSYDAVVEATGESGGGGLAHQSSVFLCLAVRSEVGVSRKISIAETACRADILDLLVTRSGNTPVKLSDIPQFASPSPAR